jgi:hypothetical protein
MARADEFARAAANYADAALQAMEIGQPGPEQAEWFATMATAMATTATALMMMEAEDRREAAEAARERREEALASIDFGPLHTTPMEDIRRWIGSIKAWLK